MDREVWRHRMDRLRAHRVRGEVDLTLSGMRERFKREVERPYKQLAGVSALWEELVPAALVAETRLEGLSRGVLRVTAGSASVVYELDRLLRGGVERELVRRHGGGLRRVRVTLGVLERDGSGGV